MLVVSDQQSSGAGRTPPMDEAKFGEMAMIAFWKTMPPMDAILNVTHASGPVPESQPAFILKIETLNVNRRFGPAGYGASRVATTWRT